MLRHAPFNMETIMQPRALNFNYFVNHAPRRTASPHLHHPINLSANPRDACVSS